MDFYYLQKVTLIDYPGKISCTTFTHRCNFSCPFCHNPELVIEKWDKKISQGFTEDKVLEFLKSRKGKLDAVVITGGEPLLWNKDLMSFLEEVKKMGYLIKVDSNGSFPEVLDDYIKKEIVDYWAMDIKNSESFYSETAGVNVDIEKIKKSIDLIKNSEVDYEFRTTVVPGLHDLEKVKGIGKLVKNSKRFVIQNFRKGKCIDKKYSDLKGFDKEVLSGFKSVLEEYVEEVCIRD